MMARKCLAVASAALLASAQANCDARAGDLCLRTLGRSGKILFCYDGSGDAEAECFTVRMRKFEEHDASGEVISAHRDNNLGNSGFSLGQVDADYEFPTVCNATGVALCGTNTNGTALEAVRVPIMAPVGGKGNKGAFVTLDLTAYIMKQDGTLNFSGESLSVQANSFKFDISARDYMPCGSGAGYDDCRQGNTQLTGATFSFDIEVAARGNRTLRQDGNSLEAADGSGLVNFAEYRLLAVGASEWKSEAADVSFSTAGNRQVVTYKFKVGQAVAYDPIVQGATVGTPSPEASAWCAPFPLLVVMCAAFALFL